MITYTLRALVAPLENFKAIKTMGIEKKQQQLVRRSKNIIQRRRKKEKISH